MMIKPTYFLGLGESGREIINYLKLYTFVTTKSHDFYGLFRYGYLDLHYGEVKRKPSLLEEIFPEDYYRAVVNGTNNDERFELWDRNSMESNSGDLVDPIDGFWNRAGKDIQSNFYKLKNNVINAIWRQQIADKIKSILNLTSPPPISNNVDFFIIGETDDPGISLFLNGLSKKISSQISNIPYGFLYIDPESQNSFDTLYEIITSYLPVSVPLYNAIYLYTDEFNDKNVTYFTAARMLILVQSILDVSGKLIDVDSDYGKGNVLLWRLGGVVSRGRESKFLSLLNNIREFLSNITINADSVSSDWNEEDKFIEISLQDILEKSSNNIKLEKAWNITEAQRFEKFLQPAWIKNVKQNIWGNVENEERGKPQKYGLYFIYYLHKKWEYYFNSQAVNLWSDEPLKIAEKFKGDHWEKAFLMSVDSFKKNIISNWGKIFPTEKWNENITGHIKKIDDLLNKQINLIGDALKFWCTRGIISKTDEIAGEQDLLEFARDYESESDEFIFDRIPRFILELLYRFYSPLQNEENGFINSNCVAGAMGNIGATGNLGLKLSGGDKVIFEGWLVESPQVGINEPKIHLDTITKNLYRNLYPDDFYYVRIYTGFGLDDLLWDSNIRRPGKPVYVDKEGERELILMKLLILILLSFEPEWNREILFSKLRPDYAKYWDIDNKGKIMLRIGESTLNSLQIYARIKDLDSLWDNLRKGIMVEEDIVRIIRSVVFEINGFTEEDKKHLKRLFTIPYTGEVNDTGRSIVSEVLKLYNAPYTVNSVIKNLENLVKM